MSETLTSSICPTCLTYIFVRCRADDPSVTVTLKHTVLKQQLWEWHIKMPIVFEVQSSSCWIKGLVLQSGRAVGLPKTLRTTTRRRHHGNLPVRSAGLGRSTSWRQICGHGVDSADPLGCALSATVAVASNLLQQAAALTVGRQAFLKEGGDDCRIQHRHGAQRLSS